MSTRRAMGAGAGQASRPADTPESGIFGDSKRSGSLDLDLIPWAGGPEYYSQFPSMAGTEWEEDTFFPLGVWGAYVDSETYWDRYANCGMKVIWQNFNDTSSGEEWATERGMWVFHNYRDDEWSAGNRQVGWFVQDEMDMWCGGWFGTQSAGWNAWNGGVGFGTVPDNASCGFTCTSALCNEIPADGMPRYVNYGKGIAYGPSFAQGHPFFTGNIDPNDGNPSHIPFQIHMVSVDAYWYGDANIGPPTGSEGEVHAGVPAGQVRRAINYGQVLMTRQRGFSSYDNDGVPRQQIGVTLDVGAINPGGPDLPNVDVMEGAAWASLIYEARLLTWFSHAEEPGSNAFQEMLGTSTTTYANNMRAKLTGITSRIQALAPVLNTQSYSFEFSAGLDTMLKAYQGYAYIFAMQARAATTAGTFTLNLSGSGIGGDTVEVLNEDRTINVVDNEFSDNFANEWVHHIYKVAI